MQLATLIRNMFLGDDHSGRATDFSRVKRRRTEASLTLNLEDDDNHLLKYLIWPMNTFHLIAKIFDTYDVYQKIVSIENNAEYLKEFKTGNHARTWTDTLLNAHTQNEIEVSPRFYKLLFGLFSGNKAKEQIEKLLNDSEYLKLLFELYSASDECAYSIQSKMYFANDESVYSLQSEMYRTNNTLIRRYAKTLVARKERSIISSLSQCDKSNGIIQFKTHTPQSGISLNSLSHNLAYIKPGIEVAALVGKSIEATKTNEYNVLVLPWPLEIKDEFFKQDNKPTLQMNEKFGFFSYENLHTITYQMIVYAIESSEGLLDLVV